MGPPTTLHCSDKWHSLDRPGCILSCICKGPSCPSWWTRRSGRRCRSQCWQASHTWQLQLSEGLLTYWQGASMQYFLKLYLVFFGFTSFDTVNGTARLTTKSSWKWNFENTGCIEHLQNWPKGFFIVFQAVINSQAVFRQKKMLNGWFMTPNCLSIVFFSKFRSRNLGSSAAQKTIS